MQYMIDLRSDTLTLPTAEMLQAMLEAKLGDDGRTRGHKGEDPTAVEVEEMVAGLLGMEDALFVPSGTMGNTVCVAALAKRGEKVITTANSHIYKAERALFDEDLLGRQAVLIPHEKGVYDLKALRQALKQQDISVVCTENTYNFEGGAVISREQTQAVTELCKSYQVPVHLDGARIFHAASALGLPVAELIQGVCSIMFCVSKGLCAPIGSFIAGDCGFIKKARETRKALGGQLRQVGMLEAAGKIAVEQMSKRVGEDNALAFKLAQGLQNTPGINVDLDGVKTNIVKLDIPTGNAGDFIRDLEIQQLVRTHYTTDQSVRLVTYYGISESDVEEAVKRIRVFCQSYYQ